METLDMASAAKKNAPPTPHQSWGKSESNSQSPQNIALTGIQERGFGGHKSDNTDDRTFFLHSLKLLRQYIPNAGFTGTEQFRYTVQDGHGVTAPRQIAQLSNLASLGSTSISVTA